MIVDFELDYRTVFHFDTFLTCHFSRVNLIFDTFQVACHFACVICFAVTRKTSDLGFKKAS